VIFYLDNLFISITSQKAISDSMTMQYTQALQLQRSHYALLSFAMITSDHKRSPISLFKAWLVCATIKILPATNLSLNTSPYMHTGKPPEKPQAPQPFLTLVVSHTDEIHKCNKEKTACDLDMPVIPRVLLTKRVGMW